jgi:hypothetical protein
MSDKPDLPVNMDSPEFLLSILQNIEDNIPKTRRNRHPNWRIVKDFMLARTSHGGCTSCCKFCEMLGVDPYGRKFEKRKDTNG